ncbi:MAG: flagellar hook-length control protein FliK [Burkholderiales bacterium]|nr:flagellar hook-length control protein FliK [Burkholderiales bacterium]
MAATATQNIMLNLVASMNAGNKPAVSGDNASASQFETTLTQQLQARQSEQASQTAEAASQEPPPSPTPIASPAPAANPASNPAASANKANAPQPAQASNQANTQQAQTATTANSAAANNGGNTTNSGKTSEGDKAGAEHKTSSKDTSRADGQTADQAANGAAATVLSQLQNLLNDGNGAGSADTGRTGGLGERLLGGHDPKAIAARESAVGADGDLTTTLDDKLTAALGTDAERQALPVGTTNTANAQGGFADLLDRKLQIADAGQIRQQMAAPVVPKTDARTQAADTAKPSASIYQAVGAEGWDSALGTKVVMMVSNQQNEVEMHLNPPHLGPIDVKLSLDQDQATVTFVAAHANVRDAIQSSVPTLNQMLAESGIQLAQTNVQARSQNQEGGNQSSGQGGRRNGKQADQDDSKITPVGWQPRAIGGLPGNVNLFI